MESRGSERRYLFISTSLLTLIYCVYISYVVGVLDGTPSWCSYTADPPPNKNFRQMFNKAYICRQMYFVEQNVRQKHKSVDKICFCRTNVRQIAYSCRQKFRQNTFLAGHWSGKVPTKHIFVDKICFVEQSSGKIEICRQNMLCRTFFRQKYALSDIFVEQNVRQNHTVDKCMLSGPAGPGGRAARWQAQPAGPKSYCRQIYAFGPAGLGGRAAYIIQSTVF